MQEGSLRCRELLIDVDGTSATDCAIETLRGQLQDVGIESGLAVPITVRDRLAGALLIAPSDNAIDPQGLNDLNDLVDRLSVALTNFAQAESLYRGAHFDSLTGLINRFAFEDQLKQTLNQSKRGGAQGAVLYMDLDRFKQINDTEGHKVGDRLLVRVAKHLNGCLREEERIARLGGDEFAVIVSQFDREAELVKLCERIITAVCRPMVIERIEHSISISIGISVFPKDGTSVDELLMCADAAMYRAKEQEGGAFSFYDKSVNESTRQKVLIEAKLRKSIVNGDLQLYFQPQLDVAKNLIVSAEGLLRWHDEELGHVSPAEFIPIAEDTGLIHSIGTLVLEQASATVAALNDCQAEFTRMSVNASPKELMVPGFARRFLENLDRNRMDPGHFEVEVTESIAVHDLDSVNAEFEILRRAGVKVALDDFGTGYSSLNILRTLALDTVKIDRSFVIDLAHSEIARSLMCNIIQFAKVLSKTVVVEGVESALEIELLKSYGCDLIQGFALSPAIPADEFVKYVIDYNRAPAGQRAL
jgi:diguanylate cyclase (GGDEF)-like protein